MPKFYGEVGYVEVVDTGYGDFEPVIVKRNYAGDILNNTKRWDTNPMAMEGQKVNDDLKVTNQISIIADAYAYEHFFGIAYVRWSGVRWKVNSVTVERPRLILNLGGVYNATPE